MSRRDSKRAFLFFQANTVLGTCFCGIFYPLPIHYFQLFFSENKSIAIPSNDTGYFLFWMACKKDNRHTIHKHIIFAGPKPLQMQADRLTTYISYRNIAIAISIPASKIRYFLTCVIISHILKFRNYRPCTIIPFHPSYIKAYKPHDLLQYQLFRCNQLSSTARLSAKLARP